MFITIVIVSLVTLLIFIQNKQGKDNALFKMLSGICFAFSWVLIVMWCTVMIETWQIALNTPTNNELISEGERIIQNLLRSIVFLFPVSRLTLGILYALPIFLIPLILLRGKWSQMTSILLHSTLVNLLFFWSQLIIDNWLRLSFMRISLQGLVLLITYVFVIYVLIRQRSFTVNSNLT